MNSENVDPSRILSDTPPPAPRPASEPAATDPASVPNDPSTGASEPAVDVDTGSVATDDGGTPFDPAKHLSTKHPRTGRWMPRRQPKENGNGTGPTDPGSSASFVAPGDEPTPQPTPQPAAGAGDVCTVMADLHCRAFYGLTAALLSEEWLPDKPEHAANRDVLAAYYRAKNMTPDSPGWALVAQLAAYAGKRLTMPKTQTRLGMFKAWVMTKFAGWRGARRAAAIQSATS